MKGKIMEDRIEKLERRVAFLEEKLNENFEIHIRQTKVVNRLLTIVLGANQK